MPSADPPATSRLRLRNLWRPRHPLFWQMIAFNVLGSACGWALRALPLNTTGLLLIGSVGLLNSLFGMLAMWRLLHDAPEAS